MICQLIGTLVMCNSNIIATFPQNPAPEVQTYAHAKYMPPEWAALFNRCNVLRDDDAYVRCIQRGP